MSKVELDLVTVCRQHRAQQYALGFSKETLDVTMGVQCSAIRSEEKGCEDKARQSRGGLQAVQANERKL